MKLGHSSLLLLAGAMIGAQATMRSPMQDSTPLPPPSKEPEPDLPNYCGVGTIEPLPRETECFPTVPRTFTSRFPYQHKEISSAGALANREARQRAGLVGRRHRS